MPNGVTFGETQLDKGSELLISIVIDILGVLSIFFTFSGPLAVFDIFMLVVTIAWIILMFLADGEDPLDLFFATGFSITGIAENYLFIDLLPTATIAWMVKWSGFTQNLKQTANKG